MLRQRKTYKAAPLERIFKQKYDPRNPQDEISFTHEEVKAACDAEGIGTKINLANFVKDLVRTGNPHPASESAYDAGYLLKESTEPGVMGVFFKGNVAISAIAVNCPTDLAAETVTVKLGANRVVYDSVRPDEGGLLSVIRIINLLDIFFELDPGSVQLIQAPVKLQPSEIDGIFSVPLPEGAVIAPCEAKSKSRDAITLNQIRGGAASALDNFLNVNYAGVVPIAAKIMPNGDIYVVKFPFLTAEDREHLNKLITASSVIQQARYKPDPKPPNW